MGLQEYLEPTGGGFRYKGHLEFSCDFCSGVTDSLALLYCRDLFPECGGIWVCPDCYGRLR